MPNYFFTCSLFLNLINFYSASTNHISERIHENQFEVSKSIENISESDKKAENTKISSQNKTRAKRASIFNTNNQT